MSKVDHYRQQINSHPQVQSVIQWYQALSERDRLVVKVVGWMMVGAMVFLVIYAPLIKANQQNERSVAKRQQVYNLIAENAHRFGGVSSSGASSGPILPLISSNARQRGLKLDRYEMDGSGVRIWMDGVSFDDFIAWAEDLQRKHGIRVETITVDATDARGRVNVRVTYMPVNA